MSEILAKISVDFLINNYTNALEDDLIWYVIDDNSPITKEEIKEKLEKNDFEEQPYDVEKNRCKSMNTREYHIKRIAYLVQNYCNISPIDIEIVNDWDFSIEDGNHRLAAAIYRGDKYIEANIFGFIDNLNEVIPEGNIFILSINEECCEGIREYDRCI